jgi:hypothetical protein
MMSKKTNTLWFILGATVFNIVTTIVFMLVLFLLFFKFIAPLLPDSAAGWGLLAVFIGAIALSFVAYRFALKFLMKKIDFEKYFDPLFGPRRPPPRRD